jgi:hypothetical protein
MAQQGYRLTSALMQDSLSQALEMSSYMSGYYQDVRGSEASAALQKALDKFSSDQARYRDRINTGLGIAGLGVGML